MVVSSRVIHPPPPTHPCPGVDLGSVPEQDPDDVRLVCPGRQVQRGLPPDGGLVRGRLVLDQVDDDVHAPHEGGHVQRGQAGLGRRLDAGAVLQKQLDNLAGGGGEGEEQSKSVGKPSSKVLGSPVCDSFQVVLHFIYVGG